MIRLLTGIVKYEFETVTVTVANNIQPLLVVTDGAEVIGVVEYHTWWDEAGPGDSLPM